MLTEERLTEIIATYDSEEMKISEAFKDGGLEPLWPRFQRAASNQMGQGEATVARYAIWANTVRDNLVEARSLMLAGRIEEAERLMIRGINSLSAFSEVQAEVDSLFK
jgi:hypothetical protein